MAYSPQFKCLDLLTVVVNLFFPAYESEHFMLGRTKKYALHFPIKISEPLIAVVNLFVPGYDRENLMLDKTKQYALQSPIKMFRTSLVVILRLLGYDSGHFMLERTNMAYRPN